MALEAECVYIADIQQASIGRAVRGVACGAALRFNYRMLEDEWACGLGVALGADRILIRGGLQHLALEGAVRIMAVAAGHEPFIHFVVKWLSKLRFDIRVAGVAKLWLGDFEEIGFACERMYAVTVRATYLGLAMRRALKVRVRFGVTGQTARVDFL
jgi:hypothetical protein